MKYISTVLLLICSNAFMTMAWYGHLKKDGYAMKLGLPLIILASWGIAFFEYCFQVPGNRLGAAAGISTGQLKIMQEVITLTVFVPFLLFYLRESWRWDYLWAMFCLVGAVYFVFRHQEEPAKAMAPAVQCEVLAPADLVPGAGAGSDLAAGTDSGAVKPVAPVDP